MVIMKAKWIRMITKWIAIDEIRNGTFWEITLFNKRYINDPGHIFEHQLIPIAAQKARRLSRIVRRRGYNAFYYKINTEKGDLYFVKNMGAPTHVRLYSYHKIPFYRKFLSRIIGMDVYGVEFRKQNDIVLITDENKQEISDAVD